MGAHIDPSARVESDRIGDGSRILACARVGPDVVVGADCVLHDQALLLGDVVLEEGVSVGAGAIVGGGMDGATPRTLLRRFASLGANATVLPGVVVGRHAVVEAGAVVTENVPANAIVSGNPATITSYVDGREAAADVPATTSAVVGVHQTRVPTVTLHGLTSARDLRGRLVAAEFAALPFEPRRLFTVYDVPSESVRGAHAHRVCAQFLVCLAGSVDCLVDDGRAREEIRLDTPEVGLHIPPMIWGTQWKYTRDAVLLVLASHPYDAADYIRDYEEFLHELERRRN
jgi:acetyltransferase-like isoleucine patch superfamily enzyme